MYTEINKIEFDGCLTNNFLCLDIHLGIKIILKFTRSNIELPFFNL